MRGMSRLMVLALAVGMVAPVALIAPAGAGAGPHVMPGDWAGFYQGVGNPDTSGPVDLEITSQQGRRFGGTLTGLGGPDTIPVDGTVAESGHVSLVGSFPGVHVVVQGGVGNPNDGPEQGVGNPEIFEGSYRLDRTGIPPTPNKDAQEGTHSEGDLVLVHATGVPGEALAGPWDGTAQFVGDVGDRPLSLDLARDGTGTAMLDDAGVIINWAVGEPAPDGTAGFAAVGGGETGFIIINGKYTPADPREENQATIEGDIRLLPADGGPDQDGTFILICGSCDSAGEGARASARAPSSTHPSSIPRISRFAPWGI